MNLLQSKIPRRKRKCEGCETPFKDLPSVYSLVKGDEEAPDREDFCSECFQKEPPISKEVWGYWETSLKKPKIQLSPDQKAMELFQQKIDEESFSWCYFLAHYLKRKKQLVARLEIKKPGWLFFEEPVSSEIYTIKDQPVSAEMLLSIKEEFIQYCSRASVQE